MLLNQQDDNGPRSAGFDVQTAQCPEKDARKPDNGNAERIGDHGGRKARTERADIQWLKMWGKHATESSAKR